MPCCINIRILILCRPLLLLFSIFPSIRVFSKELALYIRWPKYCNFRGWDGEIASPPQWTWVWANSRRYWRTGKPGVLQSGVAKNQTRRGDWTTTGVLDLWSSAFLVHTVAYPVCTHFGDLKFSQLRKKWSADLAGVSLPPERLHKTPPLRSLTCSRATHWKSPTRWAAWPHNLCLVGRQQELIFSWAQSPLPQRHSEQLCLGTSAQLAEAPRNFWERSIPLFIHMACLQDDKTEKLQWFFFCSESLKYK